MGKRGVTLRYLEMYMGGTSCSDIANHFGVKRNTVVQGIRKHIGRFGNDIGFYMEDLVYSYLSRRGDAVRQKGNTPFDILFNTKRIDVKSARLGKDNKYRFVLQTHPSNRSSSGRWVRKTKCIEKEVDMLYLVLSDVADFPMYSLSTRGIGVQYGLTLPRDILSSNKHSNIKFLDYLGGE